MTALQKTGQVRFRTVLSLLVLAALLPPIVLLAVAVWRTAVADHASANAQFLAQSRNLAEIFHSALEASRRRTAPRPVG